MSEYIKSIKEKILKSAEKMAHSAENAVGPDIIIIVSSTKTQADFWQNRLTEYSHKRVIKKSSIILSVTEDNWNGPAGNGLGTLNGFIQAGKKALKEELIPPSDNIVELAEHFINFCSGKSIFMYHTAGKGTRTAPLTISEANSKPNIKLPEVITIKGKEEPLTILEGVIRQTSIYAGGRENRLSVFWGDQVIINENNITKEETHHIEIFGMSVPLDKDIASYGILIPGEKGDCSQREKLTPEEIINILPPGNNEIYKSIGSFSISLPFLSAILKEEKIIKSLEERKGTMNTDFDWWQPLTSNMDEYIHMMEKKGKNREHAKKQWKFMNSLWRNFISGDEFKKSGIKRKIGYTDVGKHSLWWDYGQNKFYMKNLEILLENSLDGEASRIFFGINEWIKNSKINENVKIKNSIVINSEISSGQVENCIIVSSNIKEINGKDTLIMGSSVSNLNSKGGICYNLFGNDITVYEKQAMATVFHPKIGSINMKTHIERDGSEDWKEIIYDNPYTYEELANHMKGVTAEDIRKAKEKYKNR